jgi:raffinose/stachyose/melibiose transport system permease protein
VWVMTGGGPGNATDTLSTLIYKNAFQFNEFAYSVALAIVLTVFVAVISGGQYRLLRRQEDAAR